MYSRNYPDGVPEVPVSSFYDEKLKENFQKNESPKNSAQCGRNEDKSSCEYHEHSYDNKFKGLFKNIKTEDIILGALILMSLNNRDDDCDMMIPILLFVLLAF